MIVPVAAFDRWLWRANRVAPPHPQCRQIDVPGGAVRVRDTGGAGRPLIFLCDPPAMVEMYDDLIAALAHARIVVIEVPGHGFSHAATGAALLFEPAVEMIETALLTLDLGPAVLFGPCVCGFVAAALAQRKRLKVAGLVLIQSPDLQGMLAWVDRMDPGGRLRLPFIGQAIVKVTAKKIAPFWLKYATGKATDPAALIATGLDNLAHGAGYPLASMLQLWTVGPADAGLDLPALAVWGRQDRSHAGTDPACSKGHAPGAEIVTVDHCGHFPELEDQAGFADLVRPFLDRCFAG